MTKNLVPESTINCDVLIIGAGGAGMRCAARLLEKEPTLNIVALTKIAHPQKSHTTTAQGGLAAVDPNDPVDKVIFHMFDTWKGSDCSADQNVIKKICECAWDQVLWLENYGMHFSRDQEGRLRKRTFGGHTCNFGEFSAYRSVFEADRTGKGIMDTTWGESLKRGVTFLNQCIAVELLIQDNSCYGCIALQLKKGSFIKIYAKATVVATGGIGQVYKVTTNCRQNTADGPALAIESGLPVMDPEAVQFHPTGIVGPGILASETLRSVGGILRNKDLEAFMVKYAPKMKELAPRDLVARAIETEIREGRGVYNADHNIYHVWIDLRHLPDEVHEKHIPEVRKIFKQYTNVDTKTELCPVRPSQHYHMGGIPTNEFGEVENINRQVVEGLYAVGECACASFHGFNRLATNSLLELITMGKIVADRVLEYLQSGATKKREIKGERFQEKFAQYLEAKGKENVGILRANLQQIMTEKAGVFRKEENLTEAIEIIQEIKERASHAALSSKSLVMNMELLHRWELDNLLIMAMAICHGALHRRESRGAHYRDDYPSRKDEFNYHTLVTMPQFGKVKLGRRDIDMSIYNAKGEYYEKFNVLERKY